MLATTLTTALALYTSLTTAHPLAPRTKDLWHPTPGTTWQIILSDIIAIPTSPSTPLTPDVDVYDVDMFGTSAATIAALHARGKKVVCYFSAGSYEPGRPDSDQFADGDLGAVMDGWPDERWVDVRSGNVVRIMEARVRVAAEKGCDAVDPDNLDGYANDCGLQITSADASAYLQTLAAHAASLGLSTGLKNAADLVPSALAFTQFVVNEQCHEYAECGLWQPFIGAGKAVFNIEYPGANGGDATAKKTSEGEEEVSSDVCGEERGGGDGAAGFSTIVKTLELDGWVQLCGAGSMTTETLGGGAGTGGGAGYGGGGEDDGSGEDDGYAGYGDDGSDE